MTITFENDNDVMVYALEKIIFYARKFQQIFVAQCVWWLASVIGLELELIFHIDNLQSRENPTRDAEPTRKVPTPRESSVRDSPGRQEKILQECEEFLRDSRRLRDIANLKATKKTKTRRKFSRKSPLRVVKGEPTRVTKEKVTSRASRRAAKTKVADYSKTDGIDLGGINRRKLAGECLRCAWPSDRKGAHLVKSCVRPIKLDNGTTGFPKEKGYLRPNISSSEQSEDSSSEEEESTNEE